jgi:N-acyl-D-amino-acid deacylase
MSTYDTIIRNGTVVDGLRNPRRRADIGIKDGLIACIGELDPSDAESVLEADGLLVAPGFVDLHTHYDSQLFWDPYCSSSSWHGVTTVVIGNCGYGFAPCRVEDRDRTMLSVTRVEAVAFETLKSGMPWNWVTFPEYIESVTRTPKAVNVAINVPLNPLMVWTMGRDRAKAGALPTDEEHREMRRLLHEAMDAGAIGFSAQRFGEHTSHPDFDGTPIPTDILHDETMLSLGEVLRERNEGFIQYSYTDLAEYFGGSANDFGKPEQAHPHVEQLAGRSGRSVLFYPGRVDSALDWVETCHLRGLPVYAQRPTCIMQCPPALLNVIEGANQLDESTTWRGATVGGVEEIKARLNSADVRERLREDLKGLSVDSWILLRASAKANARYEGMSIGQIAAHRHAPSTVDLFLDVTTDDDLKADWLVPACVNPGLDTFKRLTEYDHWIPGISDGGAHTKNVNTAFYSTLFLMTYVRDHGWLSLEDAHYKLSALPARIAGLRENLGTLSVGAAADIVVYDLNKLLVTEPRKLHDYPANQWRLADRGVGYRWVLVNGKVIIEDDQETRVFPGQVVHTAEYERKRGIGLQYSGGGRS